jgi:hypothetical protein
MSMQPFQQFVSISPWRAGPVLHRRSPGGCGRGARAVLVVDECRSHSAAAPRSGRPCGLGALGRQADYQVVVSVHAATDSAAVPVAWRLFLPEGWSCDPGPPGCPKK